MTPQEASEELKEEFEIFKTCIHKADWDNPNEELKKIIEANTMAIEVLEQQPCEDCISKEAVRKILANQRDELVKLHTVNPKDNPKADAMAYGINWSLNTLMELPSVTPKTEWIPVSERLPEDYIHVLCQFYLGGMGECYLAHGAFHVVGGLVMTCNEVVAWMPLPEPYKAESEVRDEL